MKIFALVMAHTLLREQLCSRLKHSWTRAVLLCVRDGDAQRSQLGLLTCASIAVGQRECRGIDIADGIGETGKTYGTLG